jgi:hypothetical protein
MSIYTRFTDGRIHVQHSPEPVRARAYPGGPKPGTAPMRAGNYEFDGKVDGQPGRIRMVVESSDKNSSRIRLERAESGVFVNLALDLTHGYQPEGGNWIRNFRGKKKVDGCLSNIQVSVKDRTMTGPATLRGSYTLRERVPQTGFFKGRDTTRTREVKFEAVLPNTIDL